MPKFILSKTIVKEKYNQLIPISDIISYSSKTNPLVTKVLEEETKAQFSVHLENELINIQDKSRIMFLLQATSVDQLKKFTKQGITTFVVDNTSDLSVVKEFLQTTDMKITLLLRMKLKENTVRTEKYYVFGLDFDVLIKELEELQHNDKISTLGVHFHRKTQNMSEWDLEYELSNMFLQKHLDMIDVMCIGGGLPSEYANTNVKMMPIIEEKISSLKKWLNNNDIKLIVEPGRFIAAPSVELHTKIIGIHEKTIIVDASVYSGDMDALVVPVKLLVKEELESGTAYAIKGVTPCSLDLYRYKVYLDNPKVGDDIIFLNAGAYNFASDFCNLDVIGTKVIE